VSRWTAISATCPACCSVSGSAFWSTIPAIEAKTVRFRLLTAIVFLGGLGRLYALFAVGVPDRAMLFGLTMELIVTPLLALWQTAVARRASG
jgi:hypothetical protein